MSKMTQNHWFHIRVSLASGTVCFCLAVSARASVPWGLICEMGPQPVPGAATETLQGRVLLSRRFSRDEVLDVSGAGALALGQGACRCPSPRAPVGFSLPQTPRQEECRPSWRHGENESEMACLEVLLKDARGAGGRPWGRVDPWGLGREFLFVLHLPAPMILRQKCRP